MEIRDELAAEVMNDLLVVYLAEEASPATKIVVEDYAAKNKRFAALLAASRVGAPAVVQGRDEAMALLVRTRKYWKWRKILFGCGLFLCLLPFSIVVRHNEVVFFLWRDAPLAARLYFAGGIVAWIAYYLVGRKAAQGGL
ncbi:MAG: hypothetical protein JST93_06160 [Acidobacteria bacterium]|nr:hypothetical protein [Acidobacteriota bacterium]